MIVLLILIGALFGLLYFGFQTIRDTVKSKKYAVQYAKIEPQQYISISNLKIKSGISSLWQSKDALNSKEKELLGPLVKKIERLVESRYHDTEATLRQDFHYFDPSYDPSLTDLTTLSREQLLEIEDRFLQNWLKMLEKANFKPLNQKELEFALEEDYLCTLPVKVNWEKLDESMLSRFLNKQGMEKLKEGFPEFGDKIWIFHRGIGVDRTNDFLVLQKLDVMIVRFLNRIHNAVTWVVSLVTGRPREAEAVDTFSSENTNPSALDNSNIVKRITLANSVDFRKEGFSVLFKKTQLQEPTFHDLVILYRLKDSDDKPTRTIFLKSFKHIPMADLEIAFPETTSALRPLDIISFTITGCIGIISAIVNLETDSTALGYATFFGFLALVAKTAYDYWTLMYYYKSLVVEILFGRILDTHAGVIINLLSQVKGQECKEAILAYVFLVLEGPMTEPQLESVVNKFLLDIQRNVSNITFEGSDAVQKLVDFGIASQENGVWKAVPIQEAVEILEKQWNKGF